MRLCIIFVFISLFVVSCKTSEKNDLKGDLYRISVNTDSVSDISSSAIFSKIEYIPLETREDCLVGSVDKIDFWNNKFYILDKTAKTVWIFDRNGNFETKVGDVGRGPGEYIDLNNFFIDTLNHYMILDASYKYLFYGLSNNQFVREKRFAAYGLERMHLGDDMFVTYFQNNLIEANHNNLVIEKLGKIVEACLPIRKDLEKLLWGTGTPFMKKRNGDVFFREAYNDTIYLVQGGRINPYAYIDFGTNKLPQDFFSNVPASGRVTKLFKADKACLPTFFMDNENFIFFNYLNSGRFWTYIDLKKRNCKYNIKMNLEPDSIGYACLPSFTQYPYIDEHIMVAALSMSFLKQAFDIYLNKEKASKSVLAFLNTEKYKEFKALSEKSENDNPLLVVHHFLVE